MSYSPKNQKLVPEWGVDENEQIVIVGVLTLIVMTIALTVGLVRGGDDASESADEATTSQEQASSGGLTGRDRNLSRSDINAAALPAETDTTPTPNPTTSTATPTSTTSTTAAPTTATPTTAAPTTITPTTTTPTTTPDLAPTVESALSAAGVLNAGATVSTDQASTDQASTAQNSAVATVTGTVPSEQARAEALAAAAAVDGVGEVVDQLTVDAPVQDRLNDLFELEPIQFASGSATILDASAPTLDAAAEILATAPESTRLEVQGYTDLGGPASKNLTLSQERADAVAAYLVSAGVSPEALVAKGYGETDQFQTGDLAEDYEANRRVQFAAITAT